MGTGGLGTKLRLYCGGVESTVWCVVLCCVVLCFVVLCCVVLWCGVVWCGVVWCGVVWCGVVWCGVVWCGVVWCGVVWCGVVWCGVVWWFQCDSTSILTCRPYFPTVPSDVATEVTRGCFISSTRGTNSCGGDSISAYASLIRCSALGVYVSTHSICVNCGPCHCVGCQLWNVSLCWLSTVNRVIVLAVNCGPCHCVGCQL